MSVCEVLQARHVLVRGNQSDKVRYQAIQVRSAVLHLKDELFFLCLCVYIVLYSVLCCVHFLFTLIYGSYFMCVNNNGSMQCVMSNLGSLTCSDTQC